MEVATIALLFAFCVTGTVSQIFDGPDGSYAILTQDVNSLDPQVVKRLPRGLWNAMRQEKRGMLAYQQQKRVPKGLWDYFHMEKRLPRGMLTYQAQKRIPPTLWDLYHEEKRLPRGLWRSFREEKRIPPGLWDHFHPEKRIPRGLWQALREEKLKRIARSQALLDQQQPMYDVYVVEEDSDPGFGLEEERGKRWIEEYYGI